MGDPMFFFLIYKIKRKAKSAAIQMTILLANLKQVDMKTSNLRNHNISTALERSVLYLIVRLGASSCF